MLVSWRACSPWLKKQLWQLALSDVRGPLDARLGGEVYWLIRDAKKVRRENLHSEPLVHQNVALEYSSSSSGKSEG